jgi:hypothetical protein
VDQLAREAQVNGETKIVRATEDEKEVYSLFVSGARIAQLTVINSEDNPPKISLELLAVGDFDWREARHWVPGLTKLAEVADGLTGLKPNVEGLLHTPTEKEIDMAKAKAKKKAAKAAKKSGVAVPRESAAQMFKDLIMEGKKTDDQIFAAVKAKFKLDDKKRSYVAWYRNALVKDGKKPPAAKE